MSRHRVLNRAKAAKARAATGLRARRHQRQVLTWLGAGVLTCGVGAALAGGTAVAHADNPHPPVPPPHTTTGPTGTNTGTTSPGVSPGIRSFGIGAPTNNVSPGIPTDPLGSAGSHPATAFTITPTNNPVGTDPTSKHRPHTVTTGTDPVNHTVVTAGTMSLKPSVTSDPPPSQTVGLTNSAPLTTVTRFASTALVSTSSVTQTEPPADPPANTPSMTAADPADPPSGGPVVTLVSTLLAGVGLPGSPTPDPVPSVPVLGIGLQLGFVQRELEYTLFNQPPTVNPTQTSESATGVITGTLNATDTTGAPLTYTVTQPPADGTVTISPNGTYTYTPTTAFAATGGTDQFTVAVNDGSSEQLPGLLGVAQGLLHGFAQATGLSGPDTTTTTVTLTVVPVAVLGTYTPITVGNQPVAVAFVVTPTGTFAYVVNRNSFDALLPGGGGTVSVINTATKTVLPDQIPVGHAPYAVAFAVTPTGTFAYVVNSNQGFPGPGTVSVINTATNTVTDTIDVIGIPVAVAVATKFGTTSVYVAEAAPNTVQVIDTVTGKVTATIPVAGEPIANAMAASINGFYVYVGTGYGVSQIDTSDNKVTLMSLGTSPTALAVNPQGGQLFVATDEKTVVEIATNTFTKGPTIPVASTPTAVAVSPNGQYAYVAEANGTVQVINTATLAVDPSKEIKLGFRPSAVAVSPDGTQLYVTNAANNSVTVIPIS